MLMLKTEHRNVKIYSLCRNDEMMDVFFLFIYDKEERNRRERERERKKVNFLCFLLKITGASYFCHKYQYCSL